MSSANKTENSSKFSVIQQRLLGFNLLLKTSIKRPPVGLRRKESCGEMTETRVFINHKSHYLRFNTFNNMPKIGTRFLNLSFQCILTLFPHLASFSILCLTFTSHRGLNPLCLLLQSHSGPIICCQYVHQPTPVL